ncbi:hypothetical protein BN948_01741 [Hydrogenophaga intermedia]|uniref:Uncharacterized protein n=1 Tax=Hydrogenophaga intermedia TaxID=65786 RepID=A0A1L1PRV0_HYDIT|nr:hypothetical protein [Hydrogenophaga intermedia]CDN87321.1 hypothetical protein BN948_01741 [Hydrogenophaga intermedia]
MRAWSYWFPDLAPHLPGCPNILMVHELRRAAQVFFERSRAWRVDLGPLPVGASAETIALLPADASMDLVELEAAWYDGKLMDPVTPEELDRAYSDQWRTHTGTSTKYMEMEPGVLTLYPKPMAAAAEGVRARLIVKPSDISQGLPDEIAKRYHEAMHIGAKARLMVYAKKPWTDAQMGVAYGGMFSALTDSAHTRAAKANVRARIRNSVKWC